MTIEKDKIITDTLEISLEKRIDKKEILRFLLDRLSNLKDIELIDYGRMEEIVFIINYFLRK